jgi:serine/threonine-protein kinase
MAAPTSVATPPVDRTRRSRAWPLFAAIGATALVVGAGSAAWFQSRSVPGQITRFIVQPVGALALNVASGMDVAVSPDGSQIVYTGNQGAQLFRRAGDALEPVALTGWDFPRQPFFSPNGQSVGFVAQFLLKKVPITGGPSETLLALGARNIAGATWGENGTIIFATNEASTGLEQIADSGGDATVLTRPDRQQGETDHLWPVFLPGGQAVLFTITFRGRIDDAAVAVLDLRTRKYKRLGPLGSHARYVSSGHLVYGAAGVLRAVAFDLDRLEVVGTPVTVVPQLVTTAQGAADFDVAANGTLVYVPAGLASATRTLVWVNRQGGGEEPLETPPRSYQYVRISPDGRRIALDIRDQQDDISIWEIADRKLTRLTIDPTRDRFPVWTPDRHILFSAERAGPPNVFSQASDGTGVAVQLTHSTADDHVPTSVSPDGAWAVIRTGAPQSFDLSKVSLSKDHRVEVLLNTPASEQNGEISPDGRWLAYQSNENKSGQFEIYVRPFPNVNGGYWQVSTGGGAQPLWAPGGGELFYRSLTGAVMSVKVNTGPGWSASAPAKLFDGGTYSLGGGEAFGRGYDYDSRRQRFLMVRTLESPESAATPPGFVVVQNWFEELKRLATK